MTIMDDVLAINEIKQLLKYMASLLNLIRAKV